MLVGRDGRRRTVRVRVVLEELGVDEFDGVVGGVDVLRHGRVDRGEVVGQSGWRGRDLKGSATRSELSTRALTPTRKSRPTRRSVVHDLAAGEEQEAVKERKGVEIRLVDRADDEDVLLLGEAANCRRRQSQSKLENRKELT